MSNNNEAAQQQRDELARKRLLKANDAQRRQSVKMMDEIRNRAKAQLNSEHMRIRNAVEKRVIRNAMGEDLERIIMLRDQILSMQERLEGERNRMKSLVDKACKDHGLDIYGTRAYTEPRRVEPDVCSTDVDPGNVFKIRACNSNPLYSKYRGEVSQLEDTELDFQLDAENLLMYIWQAVTTDEIVTAIQEFRERWVV